MRVTIAFALLGVALAGSIMSAQTSPQFTPKNLQVLPKDTAPADVLIRMQIMNEALGVQCGYCHKFEGQGHPANDFASDEKPAKNVARVMMRWDQALNEQLATLIKKPANQLTRVRCITCHRGAAIPVTPPSPLRPAATTPPAR